MSLVKAHRSMLSAVFCFKLLAFSDSHVLQDLIWSFAIDRPRHPHLPSAWDLDVVLRHLVSAAYEPLESLSLRALTERTLFLVALAAAKRVGELQALSRIVSSVMDDLVVSFLPPFLAKTGRAAAALPCSFCVCSLMCPLRTLRAYLERTKSMVVKASTLFVLLLAPFS